jgi:hypothetical protein
MMISFAPSLSAMDKSVGRADSDRRTAECTRMNAHGDRCSAVAIVIPQFIPLWTFREQKRIWLWPDGVYLETLQSMLTVAASACQPFTLRRRTGWAAVGQCRAKP